MIYVINAFFSASIWNDLKSIVFKRWSQLVGMCPADVSGQVQSPWFTNTPASYLGKIVMTSPHTTTSPEMIRIIYINLRCRHRLWLGTIPKMVFFQIGELLYLSRTIYVLDIFGNYSVFARVMSVWLLWIGWAPWKLFMVHCTCHDII